MMSKENDNKRRLYGQFAWIVNYQPQIKEQHIHMGNQEVDDDSIGEDTKVEEVEDKENNGEALSDDEKIVRAIAILNKEKLIKHKYDYTWVMQVMNETDGMPSYGSPQSFLTDMARLHIEGLPEITNMNKELNKHVGKFPNWTFIDKDKPETDRRINIARRFYNAYWKGI